MSLSPSQITLIKRSWGIFRNISPEFFGEVFYSRLFYEEPSLKTLFKSSMPDQYKKLIDMLTLIVSRLERMDEIDSELRLLAQRHVQYGVKAKHYAAVGHALVWTLQQGLGNDWDAAVGQAWVQCYSVLSQSMISAGNYDSNQSP